MSNPVSCKVNIADQQITVDLNNPVCRYSGNPIIDSHLVNAVWTDPALQVKTVHNAGIAEFNGKVEMLFRSHLRSGVSVLGLANSANGLTDWRVEPVPAMLPCREGDSFAEGVEKAVLIENEAGGVEDPRIIRIDDIYLITYSAYHAHIKNRVRVSLAATKDFRTFTRYGPILDRDMRNVVIFPERINGKYVGLFRPNNMTERDIGGIYTQIRIGFADDWRSNAWNIIKEPIIQTGGGPGAFSDKIGPGAPPLKTRHGWLNIFHGVRTTMDGNPYVLGVALHALDNPLEVQVANIPILFPSRADCLVKDDDYVHVPNVVFTCGTLRRDDGTILIYYGGNDTVMNVGITHEDVLAALCRHYPQNTKTGAPLYDIGS